MRFDFLPPELRERTQPLGPGAPRAGDYVVYWMRTALRATENPALDVALLAGRELKKPVFVYQGLAEKYAYASDRHHTFILEGARDVARQLAARGIGHAFHLERPGQRKPYLRELASAAALVVTEDLPVAPFAAVEGFSGWDAEVAKVAPLWRVDTACVVPFRAVRAKPERAVVYRAEREPRWEKALTTPWADVEPGPLFLPDLPFGPLTLGELSIEASVAECEIDHAVAPAQQLAGGTAAGELRWSRFLAQGLSDYARHRDDPIADGHSRLSPYLHYGMVSPFKVAREAHAQRTDGAAKFLEELLVWRELAWSFCALEPRHATVAALPEWARATLHQHEGDARVRHSYETLCRAQTGDRLWDAAQRALLGRGELHNSVRMTWGKAVIGWTRDAAEAMAVLVDLNHRYALDGRDPASYLGILYCLGGFDQAFQPEQPILGKVRPRPTEELSKRFDVGEYSRRTHRPARGEPLTVAVVGAGVAGAACARALVDAGQEVTIFEEGAEAGGRCAGEAGFDLGAPLFEGRDRRWLRWVRAWADEGSVAHWHEAFVGAPTMSSLPKRMLHELDVRLGTRVSAVERHAERWRLVADSGAGLGEYDAVVLTAPAPQTEALLKWSAPELAARVAQAVMAPQWVVRLSLTEPLGLDEVHEVKIGPLAKLICETRKPGRSAGERWVVHASHAWSRKHLEESPEAVGLALLDAFWATTGARPQKPVVQARLWREARVATPVGVPCLFDSALRVAAAGDWCLGNSLEAAFLSGSAAAGRLNALRGDAVSELEPPASSSAQLRLL